MKSLSNKMRLPRFSTQRVPLEMWRKADQQAREWWDKWYGNSLLAQCVLNAGSPPSDRPSAIDSPLENLPGIAESIKPSPVKSSARTPLTMPLSVLKHQWSRSRLW